MSKVRAVRTLTRLAVAIIVFIALATISTTLVAAAMYPSVIAAAMELADRDPSITPMVVESQISTVEIAFGVVVLMALGWCARWIARALVPN